MTSPKTPLEIFQEAFNKANTQFENLKLPESVFHQLISCRTDLQVAFNQLQFIPPADRVKIHEQISKAQLIALKIG